MNWKNGLIRTALLAVALGVLAPGSADAQVREKKQRTRITAADRKAAAEARKAKVEAAKKQNPNAGKGKAAPKGGAR